MNFLTTSRIVISLIIITLTLRAQAASIGVHDCVRKPSQTHSFTAADIRSAVISTIDSLPSFIFLIAPITTRPYIHITQHKKYPLIQHASSHQHLSLILPVHYLSFLKASARSRLKVVVMEYGVA
jgi:hypothetical protein